MHESFHNLGSTDSLLGFKVLGGRREGEASFHCVAVPGSLGVDCVMPNDDSGLQNSSSSWREALRTGLGEVQPLS